MKKVVILLALIVSAFSAEKELAHIITPKGGSDPLSDNKQIIREFYQAFNENDLKTMNSLLASNYKVQDSTAVFDSTYSKYDAFSKNLTVRSRALHEALPDFKLKVVTMMAEGNRVLARVEIQGIQRGPFLGVEPTNKPVVIKTFALFTIDGGKISRLNEVWNELGVMKQIGYIVL